MGMGDFVGQNSSNIPSGITTVFFFVSNHTPRSRVGEELTLEPNPRRLDGRLRTK